MQAAGVKRYIGLATPAVLDPRDRPTIKAKLFRSMPRIAFPALVELDGMTAVVTSPPLDWTISRIISISQNDRPATGRIRSGFLGSDDVGAGMSPADIAAFLIGQLNAERYRRAAPVISN